MSKKDFKQGMVAGAKPFGDKLDQLAAVSESAVSNIKEGIDGVNSVVNCILDDLSVQERKAVYDLDTPQGIDNLEQTEKEYLLSVLFTLADKMEQIADNQKFYLRTMKAYLEVANVQIGIDLGTIENIENITFQKIILQTVMEFLYLQYQNHEYMDDYAEFFDCFNVNRRGIKKLQNAIDHMVSLMGVEGIACHYSPLAEPEMVDETIEDILEIGNDMEPSEQTDTALLSDTVTVLDKDIIVTEEETRIFKNLRITIRGALRVCGHIVFEHCYITSENGQLYADHSWACHNNPPSIEFLNCSLSDVGEHFIVYIKKVVFSDCTIKGTQNSKKAERLIWGDAIIRNCVFENIPLHITVTEIHNSRFINCEHVSASWGRDKNAIIGSTFENCTAIFIESGDMSETQVTNASLIFARDATVQNCVFSDLTIGADDCIFYLDCSKVSSCEFNRVARIPDDRFFFDCDGDCVIENCIYNECAVTPSNKQYMRR